MSRTTLGLAAAILLFAPFGEGGRAPTSLLVLHSLALLLGLLGGLEAIGGARRGPRAGTPRSIACLLAAGLIGAAISAFLAPYPFAAGLGLWDLVVPAGLFMAALSSRAGGRDLSILRAALIASTSLQAAIAIVRWPFGGQQAAAAIFLNPDHLAAFLNLGLILSAARAAGALEGVAPRPAVFWSAATVLHFAAVALLASRGAVLGLAVSLLVLMALRSGSWPRRRVAAVAAALLAVVLVGGGMLAHRFRHAEDPYRYHRIGIWKGSLELVRAKPMLGCGPGLLPYEAPRHNFPAEVGPFRYDRVFRGAHSGVLTLVAEVGVPAAACLLAATLLALGALLRPVEGPRAIAGADLGTAFLALLVQGLVEDLQDRPALTLVPALLLGVALSARARSAAPEGEPSSPAARWPRSGWSSAGGIATLAALYLFVVAVALPYLAYREARGPVRTAPEAVARMERAARLDPLNPEYRHDHAMAVLNLGRLTPERYAQAAIDLLEARRLKPIDYRYPALLGRLEALAGTTIFDDPSAGERATRLYLEAVRLAPLDPRPRLELAGHLSDEGRPEEALAHVEEALRIEPHFVRARILEGSILARLGRRDEARASVRSLEETRALLRRYVPDSGYARDLAADAPAERERLLREVPPSAGGGRQGARS